MNCEILRIGYLKQVMENLGGPNDGEVTIEIPYDLLIKIDFDPIDAIMETAEYISLHRQRIYLIILTLMSAILAPTNIIEKVVDFVLSLIFGEEKVYF